MNDLIPEQEPADTRCRITELAVLGIALVAGVDVIAAAAVSIFEHRSPLVLGDAAKVGMGALAGVALGTTRAHQ